MILKIPRAVLVALLWAGAPSILHAEDKPAPAANAEPQQTTASFGDWLVRCAYAADKKTCEVTQSIVVKGQTSPSAQIAMGHLKDRDVVTVVIPNNVSFDKPLTLDVDTFHVDLAYTRCVPGACFASAPVNLGALLALTPKAKTARLGFADAGEQIVSLTFSLNGFNQAVAGLKKETGQP